MITPEQQAQILRLYKAEHWRVGTIAYQLHLHHDVVTRVLSQAGLPKPGKSARKTLVDRYIPFIVETLKTYPRLTAARLYEMVKSRGYKGGPDHFRAIVARHRPKKPAEAYLRLRTLPGEQAQVDWGHFGRVEIGRAKRPLVAFVMVLSFSRRIFLRYFLGQSMGPFLRGHTEAFDWFGGVPRVLLYDNLKSAVVERVGDAIHFNETLLSLAAHYRFEPRPVAVARGNEKGRVERAIRYVRDSFFAARQFKDLDDLNAQAMDWCLDVASKRACPEDRDFTVEATYHKERPHLLSLPATPFAAEDRKEVSVGKTPYVRFDLNDYSVPCTHVRKKLVVFADEQTVRIIDGNKVIAQHPRSFDKGGTIEDAQHIAELVAFKSKARKHRGKDRLAHAVPTSQAFLIRMAERGKNIGGAVSNMLSFLDDFGPEELEAALMEACERDTIYIAAVRQVLDRRHHEKGQRPKIPLTLPADPRIKSLIIQTHPLDSYDALTEESSDES